MKKFTTTMKISNSKEKEITVWLDDVTSAALEASGDNELIHQYIIEEYKSNLLERRETRRHVSLDNAMERGFDITDLKENIEENVIKNDGLQNLQKAINSIEPKQKWLIEQIYLLDRTQVEIARELGIDTTSVRDRLKTIYKKIRKFLK